MEKTILAISDIIDKLLMEKGRVILAIDGRCASGKTTLASRLQKKYECNLIHMDDFYLRDEQRTEERLRCPGENIDHERFLKEVLEPLEEGRSFQYRPYNCAIAQLGEPIVVEPHKINIIEGSYSCHSKLWNYYDARIFMTVESDEQLRRIIQRDGASKAEVFKEKWIPLEEQYFEAYQIEKRCEYCICI